MKNIFSLEYNIVQGYQNNGDLLFTAVAQSSAQTDTTRNKLNTLRPGKSIGFRRSVEFQISYAFGRRFALNVAPYIKCT